MKLYLDTAKVQEWDDLMPFGIFTGITTNTLLASRAGLQYGSIDWPVLFQRAADLGATELHAQVYGDPARYIDWAGALYEAGRAAGIDAVVKVPMVAPALKQFSGIQALGGKTLLTAAYGAQQALVANAFGATYLAPYLGRMRDTGVDDIAALAQMVGVTKQGACQVLAASIRSTDHLMQIAAAGAPCATFNADVAQALIDNPTSIAAWEEFEDAAKG